jgi:cell division protein FtsQ
VNTAIAPLPVDIRIMQKMTAWLWLFLGAMALAGTLMWAGRLPYFSLGTIVVDGDTSHNNALTIRANVAPRLRGNFFSADLQSTQAVFESLPWVRKAIVRREFPNRLRVVLQEHQPVGTWGRESEFQLLNEQGEVFEANPGDIDTESMPHLLGPLSQAPQVLQAWRRLRPLVQKHEMDIESLELSDRGNWQMQLDSGAVIDMGRGDMNSIYQKLETFFATVTQATGALGKDMHKDIEHADLRHSNGYALKLRGIGTLSSTSSTNKKPN